MVGEEPEHQQMDPAEASVFVIRLGDDDGADFAVCHRVGTVEGSRRLPGVGMTVAQIVAQQQLLAAAIMIEDHDDLENLAQIATGKNED